MFVDNKLGSLTAIIDHNNLEQQIYETMHRWNHLISFETFGWEVLNVVGML